MAHREICNVQLCNKGNCEGPYFNGGLVTRKSDIFSVIPSLSKGSFAVIKPVAH